MLEEEKKKPEKIEIDKDFLDDILRAVKANANLIKKLEEAGSGSVAPPILNNKIDYSFQCVEIAFLDLGVNPGNISSQNIVAAKVRVGDFRKELETLMKKFRVARVEAVFLKKL